MSENSRQSESHIDSIVRQEEEALERRSSSERLADAVGAFAGSLPFIAVHLVFLLGWLLVNDGEIRWARPFDPYPFSLLGVIVAVEAVILSSFILMRQNRMMRRGERRDHLNLQVDLLAEKEITKVLQMVRAICGHMGLQSIIWRHRGSRPHGIPTSVHDGNTNCLASLCADHKFSNLAVLGIAAN